MDHKNFKRGFLSKFSWYWGIVVGLFASSLLVFAAVNIITFSPDTPISSSEVNQNFSNLKQKIDEVSYSVVVGLGIDQVVSSNEVVQLNTVIRDDAPGAFNPGTYRFTVPTGESGFYTFYFKSRSDISDPNYVYLKVNGNQVGSLGSTSTDVFSGTHTVYLNDNDFAEVYLDAIMYGTTTIYAADTVLLIKREAKL
ncbi:MAG: hypothetical protein CME66_07650 [Halobacteriovoraceae bacterium]|nr:hypothetical protein [Halobacteriovoraceae bacterium]